MTHTGVSKKSFIIMGAIAVFFLATAAQAAFEWRGPAEGMPENSMAVPSDDMTGLEPVIAWDGASMPAEKVGVVESVPVTPPDMGEVLSGFGTDLPMAIALQQVVPAGYQFSFAPGVNPGAYVSWEGGKPWKTVLSDMLAAQGLGYRISDSVVTIGYFKSAPQPQGFAQVSPPAPVPLALPPAFADEGPVTMPVKPETVTIRRQRDNPPVQDFAPVPPPPVDLSVRISETPAPVMMSAPVRASWTAVRGQTLRDVLKNWSEQAGVELYWSIDYDYRLNHNVDYAGSYDESVARLLDVFKTLRPQPYGQLHEGTQGGRVLVVKSYDLLP
jgi:hypothetical protein